MKMETELKPAVHSALKLDNVYVDKASYDGKDVPLNATETKDNFKLGFRCEFLFPRPFSSIVKLGCIITTPETKKELTFNVCGEFSYGQDLADDNEKLIKVLRINAVSILFPYLRSNVFNFSSMTDLGLFQIPLLNITKVFSENKSS